MTSLLRCRLLDRHNQSNATTLRQRQMGLNKSKIERVRSFISMSKIEGVLFHVAPVLADAHLSDDWDRELSDVFHLLLDKLLQFLDLFRNNIKE